MREVIVNVNNQPVHGLLLKVRDNSYLVEYQHCGVWHANHFDASEVRDVKVRALTPNDARSNRMPLVGSILVWTNQEYTVDKIIMGANLVVFHMHLPSEDSVPFTSQDLLRQGFTYNDQVVGIPILEG